MAAQAPFRGKVALVTGSSGGIGQAIVRKLDADGATVVGCDLAFPSIRGPFIRADLRRREDCRHAIDTVVAEHGGLHLLVNNAGVQHIEGIEAFPEDSWDEMMALMLTAPFLLSRYAWPTMKSQGFGRIVNMGSVLSLRGAPFKSAYVTAKHGLVGLTRTLALEGGPHGINVHVVCPSYVRTPLVEGQIPDQARTRGIPEEDVVEKVMLAQAAIKRLIEPEEIAQLVSFLCREESAAMTGSPVVIDVGADAG